MEPTIRQAIFTQELLAVLTETFETHHGIYLDKDTSLFDTLKTINAAEASIPVGGNCATLAAQVAHVTFYLEVLERYILTGHSGENDWGEIWRTIRDVTPEQWTQLSRGLHETYQRILKMVQARQNWNDEQSVGGALAIVVHSAYHLGEIRQALCTLR